jgi:hypothetical protein
MRVSAAPTLRHWACVPPNEARIHTTADFFKLLGEQFAELATKGIKPGL